MANEKFWLIFEDEPTKKYYIDEPINYRQTDFNLDRKENGHALDVSLSGGKVNLRFTDKRNHYLDKILYWNHKKGFEASLLLGFSLETGEEFLGEFDFYTADTNDFNYFECSVIVQSEMQIFKRRFETKVDLFSDRDIDGNTITPLQPINMLLQAKPVVQNSKWESTGIYRHNSLTTNLREFFINPAINLISSGIDDSYTFFSIENNINTTGYTHFKLLKAQSNLNYVTIKINKVSFNLDFYSLGFPFEGGTGTAEIKLILIVNGINSTLLEQKKQITDPESVTSVNFFKSDTDYEIKIPRIDRDQEVFLCYNIKIVQTNAGKPSSPNPFLRLSGDLNIESVEISSESVAYNSVFPTFRLIDVMRQVSKSISGLDIYAPRYELSGEFYDTVLTNGNLLRNITDKPFYISWEDIEKSIVPEHNADSEIMTTKQVFVGIEKDFYTNQESGFFDNTQFSGMSKKTNPEFALNKFVLKYGKYQSLKENTEPNSESTIHGESQLTPYNQKVENSKENSIDWVRDAILLDVQQRLSTKVSTDTATQDDDTIFAIDTVLTTENQKFTETTSLQHTYLGENNLSLRTTGEVNFIVLGITPGTVFNISAPDSNNGDYTVTLVFNTEIQLARISGGSIGSGNNGARSTKYTYEIKKDIVPLTNRTDQGFTTILNLSTPTKYSNLRYSVERNIRNYWNSFLATVNLYWAEKAIKNTYYKNNGKCETEYNGLRVVEKEDFIPTEPIVTPVMYENVIFANVEHSEYLQLQLNCRNQHGFIRTIDNNRRVLKLYPLKMSYEIENKQLTISGKEKFEKAYLEIVKNGNTITINGETYLTRLKYEVDEGNKIILLDLENERLYNGVYWDKVSVNGANAVSLNELKKWLDLLK